MDLLDRRRRPEYGSRDRSGDRSRCSRHRPPRCVGTVLATKSPAEASFLGGWVRMRRPRGDDRRRTKDAEYDEGRDCEPYQSQLDSRLVVDDDDHEQQRCDEQGRERGQGTTATYERTWVVHESSRSAD